MEFLSQMCFSIFFFLFPTLTVTLVRLICLLKGQTLQFGGRAQNTNMRNSVPQGHQFPAWPLQQSAVVSTPWSPCQSKDPGPCACRVNVISKSPRAGPVPKEQTQGILLLTTEVLSVCRLNRARCPSRVFLTLALTLRVWTPDDSVALPCILRSLGSFLQILSLYNLCTGSVSSNPDLSNPEKC